jgi:hypothetical protein
MGLGAAGGYSKKRRPKRIPSEVIRRRYLFLISTLIRSPIIFWWR